MQIAADMIELLMEGTKCNRCISESRLNFIETEIDIPDVSFNTKVLFNKALCSFQLKSVFSTIL